MEKFERNGVMFTAFEHNGETYLCTGNPTGEIKLDFIGEIRDYYYVVGATSVVSGNKSVDELYTEWLGMTEYQREVLNITY